MKAIAKVMGNHIARNSAEPASANVIAYAIEGIFGEIVKVIAFAIIGWLLNCFVEMMFVVFSYIILRTASGGPHCTSYMRCFIVGGLSFTPLALLATLATAQIVAFTIIISCLFTAFGIMHWVPGEWHKRKLRKPKVVYQNVTIIMVVVIHAVTTILLIMNQMSLLTIALAIQLGTLWQFVNISPFGYKLIHNIDQFMIHISSIFIKKGGMKRDEV